MGGLGFGFESRFRPLLVGHNSIKNLLLWSQLFNNEPMNCSFYMVSHLEPISEHIFSWDVLSWLPKVWKHTCHAPLLISSLYCHLGPSVISWIRIWIRIQAAWIRIQENRDGFGFVWIRIRGVWIRIRIQIRDVQIRTSLVLTSLVVAIYLLGQGQRSGQCL